MSNRLTQALVLLAAGLTFACTYETDDQMSEIRNFAVFTQPTSRVVDALTAELVARDALSADLADELEAAVLGAFNDRREALLNSESVALGSEALARLVPEEFRRFIGEEGGRYVLELTMEPAADGGLRLSVTPTIIATVEGGEGPLGGRPLPSNGTLENSILDSLARRLGG
ncbi:MAG: hypothetical protein PVJ43_05095 [Gemmatimonadales bacterium]